MLGNFDKLYGNTLQEATKKNCWKGYRKSGTKKKGNKRVNNCVKKA